MAVSPSVDASEKCAAYGPVGRSAWLDVDWQEHRRFIEVAGRAVNIVELGSGPPLLFVHGIGGCWQNWLENLPEFARDHRVVAVDLPGFGASQMPLDGVSVSGYADCLEAVCEELSIERAPVIGNSLGGFVAAQLAIARPQLVERLVLVSAAGLHVAQLPLKRAFDVLARAQPVYGIFGGWIAAHASTIARRTRLRRMMLSYLATHPDQVPWPIVAEQVAGAGRPAFLPALRAITRHPLRDRLGEISCPTLIVWGERDHLVPVSDAAAFEALIAGARKIVYPDTGHVPMLERPARFNADLRAFLEEPLAQAPPSR
jgi:pimeloyl-ACP methyl ester carboxylesterase